VPADVPATVVSPQRANSAVDPLDSLHKRLVGAFEAACAGYAAEIRAGHKQITRTNSGANLDGAAGPPNTEKAISVPRMHRRSRSPRPAPIFITRTK